MTTTVANIIVPLVGQLHTLTSTDISNWGDVITELTTSSCPFTIEYNNVTYDGTVARSADSLSIIFSFTQVDVLLPSGMCMVIVCVDPIEEPDGCYDNNVTPLDATTRLMAMDDDGCPIGYITMAQLLAYLTIELNIPASLCDLLGGNIPEGALVGADRILTTVSGGCSLKSVPQTDVICP